jgi:hypothetical protein
MAYLCHRFFLPRSLLVLSRLPESCLEFSAVISLVSVSEVCVLLWIFLNVVMQYKTPEQGRQHLYIHLFYCVFQLSRLNSLELKHEWWWLNNFMGCGKKQKWRNSGYHLGISLKGLRKPTISIRHDRGFLGRDSNMWLLFVKAMCLAYCKNWIRLRPFNNYDYILLQNWFHQKNSATKLNNVSHIEQNITFSALLDKNSSFY